MSNQIKPHINEKEYTHSPENQQATLDMADALVSGDAEEIRRVAKKIIFPLDTLKILGKDFINDYGFPTITAELANDTQWLK